jgi:hypothetical protein
MAQTIRGTIQLLKKTSIDLSTALHTSNLGNFCLRLSTSKIPQFFSLSPIFHNKRREPLEYKVMWLLEDRCRLRFGLREWQPSALEKAEAIFRSLLGGFFTSSYGREPTAAAEEAAAA